ncbi:MAG TPA: hypothetical protein VKY74_21025 [Chloroflexia bacterium]|nr:hypothetical protein [Chloroflexia bacterium]
MAKRVRAGQPDIAEADSGRVPPAAGPRRPNDNSLLLGLVAGALAGAGLTLLITPASGARVRARLRAGAQPHSP